MKTNGIYLLFLFVSFLFSSWTGKAQKALIIDESDLQPLENVEITGKYHSTTTDSKGYFSLTGFKDDDTLIIRHLAYKVQAKTKREIITAGNRVTLSASLIMIGEVVHSANKILENKSDIPQKIDVINSRHISFNNPQTSGDLLQQTGNVFVQQTQMGGSSPVLRGFEANKVLLVVDGIRMNNAIFRSGHLQNVITIDPGMLERVEVVFGPGSVIYGSDAIGGVMSFFTRNPVLSGNDKTYIKAGAFTRYSSANNEFAGNIHVNFGFRKWAALTSVSYKSLGDLRMGANRDPDYQEWGKSLYFADRINRKDTMMVNPCPDVQKRSGYFQYDALQKVIFQPHEKMKFILNLQFSNSGDVPRYDRLSEMDLSTRKLKYADWYYGPQTRFLSSLSTAVKAERGFFDDASFTAAYQNISEDRINRRFNRVSESHQEETVDVLSLNVDLMKQAGEKSELRYGAEAIYNHVGSEAYNINISTNLRTFDNPSRYPDEGNDFTTLGLYATHNLEFSRQLIFSQGIRFSAISLRSAYSDAMMEITRFPFIKEIEQHSSAFNGNLGLVFMPEPGWRIALMGSSGFRAPNVDDIGKVNDSKAGNFIVLPNPDLKPEYARNLDLTVGKTIRRIFQIEFTGFCTWLRDAIVVQASEFNGQSTLVWNGVETRVQKALNGGRAYVYGVQGNLLWQLTGKMSLTSTLNYTHGRLKQEDEPMDHIPPLFGMTSLKYSSVKFRGELYARYNGWKHLEDYSKSGEDNLPQATPEGTPPWITLNFRSDWQLNEMLRLQVGMENLLDRHYRYFASGISSPGRNLIVALRIDI